MSHGASLMSRDEAIDSILAKGPVTPGRGLNRALFGLLLAGLVALVFGALINAPGWWATSLLVATLIIAGLSQVGIIWSAIFQITNARWGRSFRRMMELTLVASPLALLGLLLLFVASDSWVPFAHHHLEGGKGVWLNVPFWAVRNFVAVLLLFLLSAYYLVQCLRPDLGLAKERGKPYPGWLTGRLTRNWMGAEAEIARANRRRSLLAPILCFAYAVVYSMVGFDMIMALDIYWYSTLFGAYHFIGNVYLGLAVLILLAGALRRSVGPLQFFSGKHFGILGAMLFAFGFLMGDFFWSQFLTIYYGNLPEETPWVLLRTMDQDLPYHYLAWAVLAGFFVIPFIGLLFRAVKWVPRRLGVIAVVVILAMVSERFLTAAPPLLKLQPGAGLGAMLGPLVLTFLVTGGFLAAGGLLYSWFMRQVPMLPVSDPLLMESLKDTEERD